jgi:hypothetical protein
LWPWRKKLKYLLHSLTSTSLTALQFIRAYKRALLVVHTIAESKSILRGTALLWRRKLWMTRTGIRANVGRGVACGLVLCWINQVLIWD